MTTPTNIYNERERETRPRPVALHTPGDIARGEAPAPCACAYIGGADQMFVTYELELGPDAGEDGSCPQVTRVYLSGDLCSWEIGTFKTRSGAEVYGVKIEYQQTHETYRARDLDTEYESAADTRRYTKIIEVPRAATTIELRAELPDRYRQALHQL